MSAHIAGRYDGKVAVVTGGASGIGAAIVHRILAEGGQVVVGDVNDDELARLTQEFGARVLATKMDVRYEAEVEALVGASIDRFGRLDACFNAAGIVGGAPIWELSEEEWVGTIDVCLKGCFLSVKHEARTLREQGEGGAIVNIGSLMSQVPVWGSSPYTVAKAGVEMLTKNAALELGEYGIRVVCVAPGVIATKLSEQGLRTSGVVDRYLERIPLGRVGQPDDVAAIATFLGSEEAAYISGVNVIVDGGWSVSGHPDFRTLR